MIRMTMAALTLAALTGPALAGGVEREELRRDDLTGAEGTEVIVARLTILPGGVVPKHTHNGDEFLYVLEGGTLDAGGKAVEFRTGMSVHFPRGLVHGGLKNETGAPITVLTTHIVDKGKPLNVPAE